jgi:hypothetical protein
LFYSRKCPSDTILKAYDLSRELREKERSVISGFQTPHQRNELVESLASERVLVHVEPGGETDQVSKMVDINKQ